MTNLIWGRQRNVASAIMMLGVACLLPAQVSAQTVTVDPAGTADGVTVFNDLQSAVASFAVGGTNAANAAENIVNVRNNNGPVVGSLNMDSLGTGGYVINDAVTIQGVDASDNPALAVFCGIGISNTDQTIRVNNGYPALAWQQAADLTLRNIAFIPALPSEGGTLIRSYIAARTPPSPAHEPVITIEDCVFTSNDGSNMPITTTGRPEDDAKLNDPGVVSMAAGQAAGMWIFANETDRMTLNMKNSVVASPTPLSGTSPRFEVFKAWLSGNAQDVISCEINVLEGCVFANLDGNVGQIDWGAALHMNGTADNPVIVRNLKNSSSPAVIWLYYDNTGPNQPVAASVNYARFYDITPLVISEGGAAGDGSRAFITSVTNSIFANTGDALTFRSFGALDTTGVGTPEVTVDNCVFHHAGSGTTPSALYGFASFTRPVNVTNSVFTASGGLYYGLNSDAASVWSVSDSTLSLNGINALFGQVAGSGTVNLDASVDAVEVEYVNMDDPFSPDFFKVVGDSGVGDWTIY